MKKLLKSILWSLIVFLATCVSTQAQFLVLNTGTTLKINSGTVLVAGSLVNNSGNIYNDGSLKLSGNLTNNSGSLFDAASTGTIIMSGTSIQEITGAATAHFYGTLNVDNSAGVAITASSTGADQHIHGNLSFTSGNFILNGFNLTLDGTADPMGAGSLGYIVTNSTGQLIRTVGATDILFPIGNTAYNPLVLNNAGTSDSFGTRVIDNEPANASTDHMVDRSWMVTEDVAGESILTVSTQWSASEELTNFNRSESQIGLTDDDGSSYTWGTSGAATGSNPYTLTNIGFSGVGQFVVGDGTLLGYTLDLKIVLAAVWNATNHNMDKTLNDLSLLSTTDPYGLGETVSAVPANAVDWVKVELRNPLDRSEVIKSYARFVDVNGQVIGADGNNMKAMGASAGSYYVAVLHRNHLGVVSNATVDISASPALNLSSAQAAVWQNPAITTNSALNEVETGVFALWSGDANGDGDVIYNGTGSDRNAVLTEVGDSTPGSVVSSTYSVNDVNMDGDVIYNGTGSDRNAILTIAGVATPGTVISCHIP